MSEKPLIDQYWHHIRTWIDAEGVRAPPLLARRHTGDIDMAVCHLPNEQIFDFAVSRFVGDLNYKEVIFGVDRYTLPGQGTKYSDVFTVYWWQGERTTNWGWKFAVIDYKPPPDLVIEPYNWDNIFWNAIMQKQVESSLHRLQEAIRRCGVTPAGVRKLRGIIEDRRACIIRAAKKEDTC